MRSAGGAGLAWVVGAALFLAPAAAPAQGFEPAIRAAIAAEPGRDTEIVAALTGFYQGRDFRPAWTEDERRNARGAAAIEVLRRAGEDGLEPGDYTVDLTRGGAAAIEVGISRAVLRYACDLRAGRVTPDPADDGGFYLPRRPKPLCAALAGAADAPDIAIYLAGFAPKSPEYARLKATLARYRDLAAAGGWTSVSASAGAALKVGMRDPRVGELRRALAERADGTGETAGEQELFDFDLETALRRFQTRHGLAADGVFGPATQAALDVPVEARIRQIVRNLERRRSMPDELGRRHLLVNLADFTLTLADGPRIVFEARVIVGAPYQRSPVFSVAVTAVELNPYWRVPDRIARLELLPHIQGDPNYLADNNLQVLTIRNGRTVVVDPETVDWSALGPDRFPYLLRQEPGLENALGRIKLQMPNRWDVYLHDTPARELFERTVRSFSHGCIRVQNPFDLAALLVGPDTGWDRGALYEAAANGERRMLRLKEPVPVHIVYLTARINRDGSVHFRDDVYGRDRALDAALSRRRTGR